MKSFEYIFVKIVFSVLKSLCLHFKKVNYFTIFLLNVTLSTPSYKVGFQFF